MCDLELKQSNISSSVVPTGVIPVKRKAAGVTTLDSLIDSAVQNRNTSAAPMPEAPAFVLPEKLPVLKPVKIRVEGSYPNLFGMHSCSRLISVGK